MAQDRNIMLIPKHMKVIIKQYMLLYFLLCRQVITILDTVKK